MLSRASTVVAFVAVASGIHPSAVAHEDDGVTFHDIAASPSSGITYRRTRSESDLLYDAIKNGPAVGFGDALSIPVKSRGVPGVAVLDFDRDGDLDIYVTNGPGAPNSLYSSQLVETGAVSFLDVASIAGVDATAQDSTGVCFGDIDNDDDHDLMVLSNYDGNRLFENRGDGTFEDITASSGIATDTLSAIGCSMGDIDNDGLLDIFVGRSFEMTQFLPIFQDFGLNQHNQLLRNVGGNRFIDVTASAGLRELDLPLGAPADAATITWAVAMVDIDLDGDIDIVHGDDQGAVRSEIAGGIDRGFIHIFLNDGSGVFTDVAAERGTATQGAWMGLSFGDFDRNGTMDLFGTNFANHSRAILSPPGSIFEQQDSRWFLQQADGTFVDASDPVDPAGSINTAFGWGTSAADYDNDGDTDILYHGGLELFRAVLTAPGVILEGDGAGGFSRDALALASSTDHIRRTVHGMAVGDLDGNGFVDIVSVSNFDIPQEIALVPAPALGGEFDVDAVHVPTFSPAGPGVFSWNELVFDDGSLSVELNSGNGNRSIRAQALGTVGVTSAGRVNRDGIGAVFRFTPRHGEPAMHPVLGGSSYTSQDSLVATFGLGKRFTGTLEVLWPGGVRNRLYHVVAGSHVVFPEIPCSFDDGSLTLGAYTKCVATALDELRDAGIIDRRARRRFFLSAIRAFLES